MKKLPLLIVAIFLTFAVAACGGGSSEPAAPAGPGPVALSFDGTDSLVFEPATVAQEIKSGAKVTINFKSADSLAHNWALVPADIDYKDPNLDLATVAVAGADSGEIAGGESTRFNFTAPAAGDYVYVCTISGHAAAGMFGELTVVE